jgi:AAA+ ATPase superfamily predicted ATPase
MVRFFNRERELSILDELYGSSTSSLVVLYGRRRVGKTELAREFIRNKKSVYLFVETKSEELLLRDLEDSMERVLGIRPRLDSWDNFFSLIYKVQEKLVLVFDEFQNFSRVNPDLFSKFQRYWDEGHRDSNHMFLVIGSYVGLMKKLFQGSREPLFGRATMLFNIKPFTFQDSFELLQAYSDISIEEAMKVYFILGGVPKYLLLAGEFGRSDAFRTFERLFLEPGMLLEEGKNILVLEFGSENKAYFSILEAIAIGKATPVEIASYTGIAPNTVSKYLHELFYEYEIITREEPVIEAKERSGRYFLQDNFFRFWFAFIYRNYGAIEIDPEMGKELVWKDINAYFGKAFENIAEEFLVSLNRQNRLPFKFLEIGRWWDKGEEIDIIAFNKATREALFCEVKWKDLTRWEAVQVVEKLKEKTVKVKGKWVGHYCLVAKSIEGKEEMEFLTFNLEDIEIAFQK